MTDYSTIQDIQKHLTLVGFLIDGEVIPDGTINPAKMKDGYPSGWYCIKDYYFEYSTLKNDGKPTKITLPPAADGDPIRWSSHGAHEFNHDFNITELSSVKPKAVSFTVGPFPAGKLSLIGGVPGGGKTTISYSITAMITQGGTWPYTNQKARIGTVVILTAEDDAEDTVVPRLMAAGADLSKVLQITSVACPDEDQVRDLPITLARDIHQLDGLLTGRPDIVAIIFDPLSAYLGAKDSHRDSDVRMVLGPVTALAAKHKVAIIGITHLSKNEGVSAMSRFLGSTGIIAASRAAFLVSKHEDELMMLPVKSNLAPLCQGLTYEIHSKMIADGIEASYIQWTGTTDITADEIMAQSKERSATPKTSEAVSFLEAQLKYGPRRQADISNAVEALNDFSWESVKRAKKTLGIRSSKTKFSGGWKWYTKKQFLELKSEPLDPLREEDASQAAYFDPLRSNNTLSTPSKANDSNTYSDSNEVCQAPPENRGKKDTKTTEKHPEDAKGVKSVPLGDDLQNTLKIACKDLPIKQADVLERLTTEDRETYKTDVKMIKAVALGIIKQRSTDTESCNER